MDVHIDILVLVDEIVKQFSYTRLLYAKCSLSNGLKLDSSLIFGSWQQEI